MSPFLCLRTAAMAHRSMIDETDVVKLHRAALSLTSSRSSSPSESWQSHVSIREFLDVSRDTSTNHYTSFLHSKLSHSRQEPLNHATNKRCPAGPHTCWMLTVLPPCPLPLRLKRNPWLPTLVPGWQLLKTMV